MFTCVRGFIERLQQKEGSFVLPSQQCSSESGNETWWLLGTDGCAVSPALCSFGHTELCWYLGWESTNLVWASVNYFVVGKSLQSEHCNKLLSLASYLCSFLRCRQEGRSQKEHRMFVKYRQRWGYSSLRGNKRLSLSLSAHVKGPFHTFWKPLLVSGRCYKVFLELSLLQVEQPKLSQPVFTGEVLQASHHLYDPLISPVLYI